MSAICQPLTAYDEQLLADRNYIPPPSLGYGCHVVYHDTTKGIGGLSQYHAHHRRFTQPAHRHAPWEDTHVHPMRSWMAVWMYTAVVVAAPSLIVTDVCIVEPTGVVPISFGAMVCFVECHMCWWFNPGYAHGASLGIPPHINLIALIIDQAAAVHRATCRAP